MTTETAGQVVEICLRCGTYMEWRHATFQCPRCHFKIGCCEGETAECRRGASADEPFEGAAER